MFIGIHHLHSSLRYVILFLLLITIIKAFVGWINKSSYLKIDKSLATVTMVFIHIQLIFGIILYFISPRVLFTDLKTAMADPMLRFFTVEHWIIMVLATVIITYGRSQTKKNTTDEEKHKKIAKFYLFGLLAIFAAIPWPFMKSFGSWF